MTSPLFMATRKKHENGASRTACHESHYLSYIKAIDITSQSYPDLERYRGAVAGGGGTGGLQPAFHQVFRKFSTLYYPVGIFGKTTADRCSRKTTTHWQNYVFSPPPQKNPAPTALLNV